MSGKIELTKTKRGSLGKRLGLTRKKDMDAIAGKEEIGKKSWKFKMFFFLSLSFSLLLLLLLLLYFFFFFFTFSNLIFSLFLLFSIFLVLSMKIRKPRQKIILSKSSRYLMPITFLSPSPSSAARAVCTV